MGWHRIALASFCSLGIAAAAGAQTTPPASAPPAASPERAAPPAARPAATPVAPASMPAAVPLRIRGSILAVSSERLTVKSRDGRTLEVMLRQPLTVVTVQRVKLSDIRDGAYVGVASRAGANGTRVALEVLVFPDRMRGVGAGHYAWDLEPGSMMTNAPVSGVVKDKSGRDLTLTYAGGNVTVHVAPRTPVVTLVPASQADLKRGRRVFLVAQKTDGQLSAARVTVGTHGVNPPM